MKKIVLLLLMLVFILSGCKQIDFEKNTSTSENSDSSIQYIAPSQFSFSTGDCEIKKSVSKSTFTEPIECNYNGKKITIDSPKFTGIPVESVYSYKKNYQFIDGHVIFDVATDDGVMYFKIDKNGKTVVANSDHTIVTDGRDTNKYMKEFLNTEPNQEGRIIGNNVMIKQIGEPGDHV